MTKGKHKLPLPDRLRIAMSNEHAGISDAIKDLEPYVKVNPDDNWAAGQLRYFRKRKIQLEKKLGLSKNRSKRSTGQ